MARLFVDVLFSYRDAGKFKVHAFVVMPDHIHLLLSVDSTTIEGAMQFIKGGFSYRARREFGMAWPIWQRGFSETRIMDQTSFEQHVRYTHENPARAHLPEDSIAYECCSATDVFALDPMPQGLKPTSSKASTGTTEVVP